jgi:hypothetical protein
MGREVKGTSRAGSIPVAGPAPVNVSISVRAALDSQRGQVLTLDGLVYQLERQLGVANPTVGVGSPDVDIEPLADMVVEHNTRLHEITSRLQNVLAATA